MKKPAAISDTAIRMRKIPPNIQEPLQQNVTTSPVYFTDLRTTIEHNLAVKTTPAAQALGPRHLRASGRPDRD